MRHIKKNKTIYSIYRSLVYQGQLCFCFLFIFIIDVPPNNIIINITKLTLWETLGQGLKSAAQLLREQR